MAMALRELIGREARWTQPSAMAASYVLDVGGSAAATLTFRSSFGSLATGESADGCWTFKRVGFFATRVTIRACGDDQEIAVFHNATWKGGGTLEVPGGKAYRANVNFWQTRFEIATDTDVPLVSFTRIGGAFHLGSDVQIHAAAGDLRELPWMVMLGWYLTVMAHRDSSTAAVVG
jgi:hypothetical protein